MNKEKDFWYEQGYKQGFDHGFKKGLEKSQRIISDIHRNRIIPNDIRIDSDGNQIMW